MVGLAIPARILRRRARDTRWHTSTGHERLRHARHEGAVPAPAQRPTMAAEGHRRHRDTPRAGRRREGRRPLTIRRRHGRHSARTTLVAADRDDTSAENAAAHPARRRVAASITNREAPGVVAALAFVQLAGAAPSLWGSKGGVTMPAKSSQTGSGGFTAAERAAMKQRAAELRAEGKQGAK